MKLTKNHIIAISATWVLLLLGATTSIAQTRTIEGSGNWSAAGNWQGGNIGGDVDNDDDVEMDREIDIVIQAGETYTIATFDVGRDGSLTIDPGGVLIITGTFLVDRDFILNIDGDLIIQGNLDVDRDLIMNITGSVVVEGSVLADRNATIDIQGDMQIDGDLIADRDTNVNVDGTLNVDGDIEVDRDSSLTGSGTVTTGGSCTDDDGGFCNGAPLPIELANFNVTVSNNMVSCVWATSTEEHNDFFSLERSKDGLNYEVIATIDGAGNSTDVISYEFIDQNPLFGQSYYRLKQTDFDGVSETFGAKRIYISSLEQVVASPNPVERGGQLNLFANAEEGEEVISTIYNTAGVAISSTKLAVGNNEIDIDNQMEPGFYILKVKSGDKQLVQRLLIK